MTPELKSQLFAAFVQYILPVLCTGVAAGAAWALHKLAAYLGAKASGSKVAQVGVLLSNAVASAVVEVEATLRPGIKAASADGHLTPAEGASLKAAALAKVKDILGTEGLQLLKDVLGVVGIDTFLSGLIEQQVNYIRPTNGYGPLNGPAVGAGGAQVGAASPS